MQEFFANTARFLSQDTYHAHGYCLFWDSPLVMNYVVTDSIIALSYFSIPFALTYFVSRRKDLAFRWVFVMFAIFIVGCGLTHVMDVAKMFYPLYYLDAGIRHVTATASVATAVAVWLLVPRALRLPSPRELQAVNRSLLDTIMEKERVEEELRRTNALLELRTNELEALNAELEAFSYSVSHDLRAPLRAIDGFAQALDDEIGTDLTPSGRGYLDRVRAGARRMNDLIDAMLNLARVTRSSLTPQPVDLADEARDVAEELRGTHPDRDIDFVIPDRLPARADRALVRAALENLLGNAVKFTRDRKPARIEFGAESRDGGLVYFVKDDGAGFDPRSADRLFVPFGRLHGREFSGTGVGLATVARIVHRHGGRIWAESTPGDGATFYFTLPHADTGSALE